MNLRLQRKERGMLQIRAKIEVGSVMMMVERKQKLVIFGEPFMMDSGVDDKLSVSGEG